MRRSIWVIVVAVLILAAGCQDPLSSDTESPTRTPVETEIATPVPTPSPEEQAFTRNGEIFGDLVQDELWDRPLTNVIDYRGYGNNTVELTVLVRQRYPVKRVVMDTAQATSIVLGNRTSAEGSVAVQDATREQLHRPNEILVSLRSPSKDQVGTFRIDPDTAVAYRNNEISADTFARTVYDTLSTRRSYERGDQSLVWYLNNAELADFNVDFEESISNQSKRSISPLDRPIPTENVSFYPADMRIHFHIDWNETKMGFPSPIGDVIMYNAYWRTTRSSPAIPPDKVSIYMDRPGKNDTFSSQTREMVEWLLDGETSGQRLQTYHNNATFEIIADEE